MPKVRIKLNSTNIEMLNNICDSIKDLAKKYLNKNNSTTVILKKDK